MQILEWLCQRPDGLGHLTDEERESAISFALLWMYFEARLMHTEANAATRYAYLFFLGSTAGMSNEQECNLLKRIS